MVTLKRWPPMSDNAEKGTQAQTPDDVARMRTPPPSPSFTQGDSLPGITSWRLERRLGGGGFGEVWLAKHEWKDERRAVKFCLDPQIRNRLVTHEKKIVVRVMRYTNKHPNIVPLLDCNLDGEFPWLMYEYVEGGTLAEALTSWRALPLGRRFGRAVKTLHGIASALGTCHRLDPPIIHRDIKPHNVLMTGSTPRVTDFGLSSAVYTATVSGQSVRLPTMLQGMGTPRYAPPEQMLGSLPDPGDDVYALGITAYQLFLCDLKAAPGPDATDELHSLRVPSKLVSLIVRSVAINPTRRLRDASEWERELAMLMSQSVLPAQPAPRPPAQPAPKPTQAQSRTQALADYKQGNVFYLGRGVPQDYVKALEWYKKAADQGNANAQNDLGFLYHHGHGVSQDYGKALEWYKKAADQGLAEAVNNLGVLYFYGHGVTQSYLVARVCYETAAEKGDANARANLAELYENGHGVAKDFQRALTLYREAAKQGSNDAKAALARLSPKK